MPRSRSATACATCQPPSWSRRCTRGLADNSVGRTIDTLLRSDVVLVDEMGFAPLDATGTQLLLRFAAAAYERRALRVASRWEFNKVGPISTEHTTTASLLDRLLHTP